MSEAALLQMAINAGHIRYLHSVIFLREPFHKNEAALVTHLGRPMFDAVREEARAQLLGSYLMHYWRESRSTAEAILSGSHGIDPEVTGITEEMRLALVHKNHRLHLAVTVGFIRVALKASAMIGGRAVSFGKIGEHACAHLARPDFADLGEMAKLEIFEFAKDGLMNGADEKIAAARAGDYAMFWQFANETLGSWPSVSHAPIDPALLA